MVTPTGAVASSMAAEHPTRGPVFLDDVALLTPRPNASTSLLVACDSLGGIGPKEHDRVPADPYTVGRLTCRVPLLEILALGGEPLLVVVTLAVEPEPTGEQIMAGVRDEAYQAGVPGHAFLVSTEKNVPTTQTGLGITVVGRGELAALRYGLSLPGDVVVAVGIPKVGKEVALLDPEIANVSTLRLACGFHSLHDIVPVGSGGIRSEADKMAHRVGLRFLPGASTLDMDKSAGPSTCFLVSLPAAGWPAFQRHMAPAGRPCSPVGTLWQEKDAR